MTEYAVGDPALWVINDGTDRAWLAGSSGVGPTSGVPLDAKTAWPWTGSGELWAVADPAAAAAIPVYITSAIDGWTPSPAAIAAEVAAMGVPSTAIVDTLGGLDGSVFIGTGTGTAFIDVSKYSSLQVELMDGGSHGFAVSVIDQDSAESYSLTSADKSGNSTAYVWKLPALRMVRFFCNTAAGGGVFIKLIGTNRSIARPSLIDGWGSGVPFSPRLFHMSQTFTAGQIVAITAEDLGNPFTTFNGQVAFRAATSGGSAAPSCDFGFRYMDTDGVTTRDVFFASASANTVQYGITAHALAAASPIFRSNTAQTTALAVDLLLTAAGV